MKNQYMSDEMFAELLESVRQGGAILRGEQEASRTFVIETPDVKRIRERFELSQSEFAALLGISVKTLQNWEQGRRSPHGAARVLLQVADKHPEAVWETVRPKIQQTN
jgi:putative transcriptional regulator